jgi:hypothetical protein
MAGCGPGLYYPAQSADVDLVRPMLPVPMLSDSYVEYAPVWLSMRHGESDEQDRIALRRQH